MSDYYMNEPKNDHTHKQNEPWTTLGQIRDDLKQTRAHLAVLSAELPASYRCKETMKHINRALARVGDGSRSDDV